MEAATLVPETRRASAKLLEVLRCLGDHAPVQSHFDTPSRFTINRDVEEHGISDFSVLFPKKALEETPDFEGS